MGKNNYALIEVELGKGGKYIDSRLLLANETCKTVNDVAKMRHDSFEQGDRFDEFDNDTRTLMHQIIRYEETEEYGMSYINPYSITITRNQKKTVTDKKAICYSRSILGMVKQEFGK